MALQTFSLQDDPNVKTSGQHRITDIRAAIKHQERVNVFVDNNFFCSLEIPQVVDLGIKIGRELDDDALAQLKRASEFGKFYQRALEFALTRPRSVWEVKQYLNRKTRDRKVRIRNQQSGQYQTKIKPGFDSSLVQPVLDRLISRGYVDDVKFAQFWAESRRVSAGSSNKRLRQELNRNGIAQDVIDQALAASGRNDAEEIQKIIAKKGRRYNDRQKLIQYLVRQGFSYSDVLEALSSEL